MFLRKVFGVKEEETSSSSSPSTSSTRPVCNVVLIGDLTSLGTELFKKFCGENSKGCPDSCSHSSICFGEKELKTYDGDTIALNIWNINDEKRNYKKIISQYCRGAHGMLLCHNQLSGSTFDYIKSFTDENSALLSKMSTSIQIVGIFRERYRSEEPSVSQKEVKPVARKIGAKVSDCYLDDTEGIDGMFKSLVADITKKSKIKFKTVSDLPPKPLIQPPKPPSPQEGVKDKDEESPVSLISLCGYKNAKMGAKREVKRNEDGLFGEYERDGAKRCLYYRVSVLGNPHVGKSCLCARYLEGECNKKDEGDRLWIRSFNLPSRIFLRLRMCEGPLPNSDTDPRLEEHFSRSHAVLLCYDITDRTSFDAVAAVAAGVREDAMRGAVVMVVGLKYDDKGHVEVPGEEGRALADANGMMFRECSAADNVGVQEVFASILLELQQVDLFALLIDADDARHTLKPSVLPSGTKKHKEDPQLVTLLSSIIARNSERVDGNEYDYLFRILLVGDTGVGKTNLLLRYVDDTFTNRYNPTVGVDFKMKTIRTPNNVILKLQIWDASEQDYRHHNGYCKNYVQKHAFIVCFDTTDQITFDTMKEKVVDIGRYAPIDSRIVIVGTKSDLPPVVDPVAAREYAEYFGIPLLYCSSKTGDGVDEVFIETVASIGYKYGYDFGFDFE